MASIISCLWWVIVRVRTNSWQRMCAANKSLWVFGGKNKSAPPELACVLADVLGFVAHVQHNNTKRHDQSHIHTTSNLLYGHAISPRFKYYMRFAVRPSLSLQPWFRYLFTPNAMWGFFFSCVLCVSVSGRLAIRKIGCLHQTGAARRGFVCDCLQGIQQVSVHIYLGFPSVQLRQAIIEFG